jgi:hypothetical protein
MYGSIYSDFFATFADYNGLSDYHLDNFDDSYYFDADLVDDDYMDALAVYNIDYDF